MHSSPVEERPYRVAGAAMKGSEPEPRRENGELRFANPRTGLRTVAPPPRKENLITPELETREQRHEWVVIGSDAKISHFETSTAAEQWLNAEAEICAPDMEAEARSVYRELVERHGRESAESIIADRSKRREHRQEVGRQVGEFKQRVDDVGVGIQDFPQELLPAGVEDSALRMRTVLNRDCGFSLPLEVVCVNQFRGKASEAAGSTKIYVATPSAPTEHVISRMSPPCAKRCSLSRSRKTIKARLNKRASPAETWNRR